LPRPPRKISERVLSTLINRPKLRYTITSKGQKAAESGTSPQPELMDNLIEAIQANNKQPVSLTTWIKFHGKKPTNDQIRRLVKDREITIVSRGKFSFAVE